MPTERLVAGAISGHIGGVFEYGLSADDERVQLSVGGAGEVGRTNLECERARFGRGS